MRSGYVSKFADVVDRIAVVSGWPLSSREVSWRQCIPEILNLLLDLSTVPKVSVAYDGQIFSV